MQIAPLWPLGPRRSPLAESLMDFVDDVEDRTLKRFADDPFACQIASVKCAEMRYRVAWHEQRVQ